MARAKTEKEIGISEIIKRTDKENPRAADLELLRSRLDQDDTIVKLNSSANRAYTEVIEALAPSKLVQELMRRNIQSDRDAMGYDNESIIVKLLIDRVILCQLRLSAYEAYHVKKMQESMTFKAGHYYDKILSNYQNRLLKACEALASVKKVLSEADLYEQRARHKRGQSTLNSQRILRDATR